MLILFQKVAIIVEFLYGQMEVPVYVKNTIPCVHVCFTKLFSQK